MGNKIFVSYKYGDQKVMRLPSVDGATKARDYVTELQSILDEGDHINKGEDDGHDLSDFSDEYIASELRNRIYDSSITLVLISKGMKSDLPEKDQWMPWEISYSLREQPRNGRTKKANAILAIVLPDENNSYEYYILDKSCPHCSSRTLRTHMLFKIMSDNMFNIKKPSYTNCEPHVGARSYQGNASYIHSVKWNAFIENPNTYIKKALSINENIDDFDIVKILA